MNLEAYRKSNLISRKNVPGWFTYVQKRVVPIII